tara:strand:- start:9106 stop:9429 length:324 start_codon:yes stop_codon:yes gene_type:complete
MTEPDIQSMIDKFYQLFKAVAKGHEIRDSSFHPETIDIANEVFSKALIGHARKLVFHMGAEHGYDVESIPANMSEDDWEWADERNFEKFLDENKEIPETDNGGDQEV